MMRVWRIAADAPAYTADDLTGTGAKLSGGRWNRKGTPMIYAASNRALACLETMVHLNVGDLPLNRYLVELAIPEKLFAAAARFNAQHHVGWDAIPEGLVSLEAGQGWIKQSTSAVMIVPSVIVPEEFNVLINPAHPDARAITANKVRKWLYPRPRVNTVP